MIWYSRGTDSTWELGPASLNSSRKLQNIFCTLLKQGTELEVDAAQQLWPKIEWVLSVSSVTELKRRQIKQPDTQNLKMMIGLFQVSSHLYTNREAWFIHSDNVTAAIKDNLLSSFRTKSLLASQYDVLRVSMSKLWGQKSALLLNLSVS